MKLVVDCSALRLQEYMELPHPFAVAMDVPEEEIPVKGDLQEKSAIILWLSTGEVRVVHRHQVFEILERFYQACKNDWAHQSCSPVDAEPESFQKGDLAFIAWFLSNEPAMQWIFPYLKVGPGSHKIMTTEIILRPTPTPQEMDLALRIEENNSEMWRRTCNDRYLRLEEIRKLLGILDSDFLENGSWDEILVRIKSLQKVSYEKLQTNSLEIHTLLEQSLSKLDVATSQFREVMNLVSEYQKRLQKGPISACPDCFGHGKIISWNGQSYPGIRPCPTCFPDEWKDDPERLELLRERNRRTFSGELFEP